MRLSELFGEKPLEMTALERKFLVKSAYLWGVQFDAIIRESRGTKTNTKLHMKKDNHDG